MSVMKRRYALVLVVALALATSVRSQDGGKAVFQDAAATVGNSAKVLTPADSPVTAWLPAPISNGTSAPPAPKPALPPIQIKSTSVRLIDVVESPPMPGLPPVEGTIRQTVHLVADPGLPDPPPPPPPSAAQPITDPAMLARLAAWRANRQETRTACVSAMVYDHSRTYLRCYPGGEPENEICGWSNLDFNHFTGFASFQVKGRDGKVRKCDFFIGVGNQDTKRLSALLAQHGRTYTAPAIPVLPDLATGGVAFVVTSGDTTNAKAMEIFESLHALYRAEGTKMAAAYDARIAADEERKAYLLANPPKPADETSYFWERDHPATPPANVNSTEGSAQ